MRMAAQYHLYPLRGMVCNGRRVRQQDVGYIRAWLRDVTGMQEGKGTPGSGDMEPGPSDAQLMNLAFHHRDTKAMKHRSEMPPPIPVIMISPYGKTGKLRQRFQNAFQLVQRHGILSTIDIIPQQQDDIRFLLQRLLYHPTEILLLIRSGMQITQHSQANRRTGPIR